MKKNVRNVLKLIGAYVLIYLICTIIFVALFHTQFLKGMSVLMYKGVVFILLTGVLAAILMFVFWKIFRCNFIETKDIILMFCGFCCVNMVLFTLIPVTVERSVSVFMLSYMEENEELTYTEDSVSGIFVEKYVNDYGAFEKRFHEQLVSGNIRKNEDGTYSITENGKRIVQMFRMISKWFNTDQRLVYPNEN
ncbi:MAG: hypothetical protein ACI4HI_02270 [Lachnospiraceae bacterium]